LGLTALILGIISVILSLIPFCNYIGLVPAILAIVFGVVSLTQKEKNELNHKAMSITGISFGALAVVISVVWSILFLFSTGYVR
jgi:hypothetical protein